MNDARFANNQDFVREIVTKAVIGKGRKIINQTQEITEANSPYSILGCWVINHQFSSELDGFIANVTGSYEVNIWYSYDENTKTDIARSTFTYEKRITTKKIANDINEKCRDIIIQVIEGPVCTNAYINDNSICVDVSFELLAEIIGDAKVKVAILDNQDYCDYTDDDFEDEINEDFIQA